MVHLSLRHFCLTPAWSEHAGEIRQHGNCCMHQSPGLAVLSEAVAPGEGSTAVAGVQNRAADMLLKGPPVSLENGNSTHNWWREFVTGSGRHRWISLPPARRHIDGCGSLWQREMPHWAWMP